MKRLPLQKDLLRAFLEGRKTVTRRLINPQPEFTQDPKAIPWDEKEDNAEMMFLLNDQGIRPKYLPGDIVGIGEPWCIDGSWNDVTPSEYVAAMMRAKSTAKLMAPWYLNDGERPRGFGKTRTGRFLPDALVRHKARIVSVRAERLQEITEEDAEREGTGNIWYPKPGELRGPEQRLYVSVFRDVWDTLHGKEAPWESNPWVFRYGIERI